MTFSVSNPDYFQIIFPANLSAVTGDQYTFTEQIFDNATGDYQDMDNGRTGVCYEMNGNTVSVPTFAWIRLRGIVDGDLYYEFDGGSAIGVEKSGTLIGTEPNINLIAGSNISLTVADNPTDDRVDITIDASGTISGGIAVDVDGSFYLSAAILNLINGNTQTPGAIVWDVSGSAGPTATVTTEMICDQYSASGPVVLTTTPTALFSTLYMALPCIGYYLIWAQVYAFMTYTSTANRPSMAFQLYDVTNSVNIDLQATITGWNPSTTVEAGGTVPIIGYYYAPSACNITIMGSYFGSTVSLAEVTGFTITSLKVK